MEENKPVENVQPIASAPPKSTNFLLIGLIVIFVAALTSGGTFLFMSQKQKVAEVIPLSQVQTKPTAIPTTDPTANWKTYINNNLGFSFKYPSDWILTEPTKTDVVEVSKEKQSKVVNGPKINVNYYSNPKNLTLQELDQENSSYNNMQGKTNPGLYSTKNTPFIIGGINGFYQQNNLVCEPEVCPRYIVPTKDNVLLIYLHFFGNQQDQIGQKKVFDQILSTFKFINQTNQNEEQSSNPNLKTYTSKTLGITFTYLGKQDTTEITTKELGNKVCVTYDPQDNTCSKGQFVEVFNKEKTQTLADAIKKQFLSNYSEKDCFVKTNLTFSPNSNLAIKNYEKAEIGFPASSDPNDPGWQNADKCPAVYTTTNGIAYFLMDKNHPDKFLFFSIGQYPITSENNKLWQETLTFLD